MQKVNQFVVAGHLCLDLTPALGEGWPLPGTLAPAGPLRVSVGGAIPNVGRALKRLGATVRLAGCAGDDWLGEMLIEKLREFADSLSIRRLSGVSTGYSIVIAPHGEDRAFLHCTGANAAFVAEHVADQDLAGGEWMHFGYPPVMPAITAHQGQELAKLLERARRAGLRTSLDLCSLDEESSRLDWQRILSNCAASVTVFAPSSPELRAALRKPAPHAGDLSDLPELGRALLQIGFTVVAIKAGSRGLYLATTDDADRLRRWGLDARWCGREMLAPCFEVQVVNTSGAGDCSIAGLIVAMAAGDGPEGALTLAAAAGAASAEAADASSGVPSREELEARIRHGWSRLQNGPIAAGWRYEEAPGVWRSGRDAAAAQFMNGRSAG
jgi:sugar/nucleoside kinase (ribokinase family)